MLVFSVYSLCIKLWSERCDFGSILFCYLDDSISWVWMDSVFLGIVSFYVATFIFVHQGAFYIARHLAAKLGINLAVLI